MSIINKSQQMFQQQKAQLRIVLKQLVKNLTPENKNSQAEKITIHLLNDHAHFKKAKHIGIFLTKQNEINTIPLIETILENPAMFGDKNLYIPRLQLNAKNEKYPEIEFFLLKNLFTYHDPFMNREKLVVRESLVKVDLNMLDLVLVPGLGFDLNATTGRVARIGRSKDYYNDLLGRLDKCYTIGLGFNEQFFPFNGILKGLQLPVNDTNEIFLDEFLCEKFIK